MVIIVTVEDILLYVIYCIYNLVNNVCLNLTNQVVGLNIDNW